MRTVQLQKRSKFSDKDILRGVVSNHAEKGLTIGQMRLFLKILDKLDAGGETLALEDAEYSLLIKQFDSFHFAVVHPDIVGLRDALEEATKS